MASIQLADCSPQRTEDSLLAAFRSPAFLFSAETAARKVYDYENLDRESRADILKQLMAVVGSMCRTESGGIKLLRDLGALMVMTDSGTGSKDQTADAASSSSIPGISSAATTSVHSLPNPTSTSESSEKRLRVMGLSAPLFLGSSSRGFDEIPPDVVIEILSFVEVSLSLEDDSWSGVRTVRMKCFPESGSDGATYPIKFSTKTTEFLPSTCLFGYFKRDRIRSLWFLFRTIRFSDGRALLDDSRYLYGFYDGFGYHNRPVEMHRGLEVVVAARYVRYLQTDASWLMPAKSPTSFPCLRALAVTDAETLSCGLYDFFNDPRFLRVDKIRLDVATGHQDQPFSLATWAWRGRDLHLRLASSHGLHSVDISSYFFTGHDLSHLTNLSIEFGGAPLLEWRVLRLTTLHRLQRLSLSGEIPLSVFLSPGPDYELRSLRLERGVVFDTAPILPALRTLSMKQLTPSSSFFDVRNFLNLRCLVMDFRTPFDPSRLPKDMALPELERLRIAGTTPFLNFFLQRCGNASRIKISRDHLDSRIHSRSNLFAWQTPRNWDFACVRHLDFKLQIGPEFKLIDAVKSFPLALETAAIPGHNVEFLGKVPLGVLRELVIRRPRVPACCRILAGLLSQMSSLKSLRMENSSQVAVSQDNIDLLRGQFPLLDDMTTSMIPSLLPELRTNVFLEAHAASLASLREVPFRREGTGSIEAPGISLAVKFQSGNCECDAMRAMIGSASSASSGVLERRPHASFDGFAQLDSISKTHPSLFRLLSTLKSCKRAGMDFRS